MILNVTGRQNNCLEFEPINIIFKNNIKYKVAVISVSFYLNNFSNSIQDNETLYLCSNLIDVSPSNMSRSLSYFPLDKKTNWQFFKSSFKSYHDLHIKDLERARFVIKRVFDNSPIKLEHCCIQLEIVSVDGGVF